MAAVPAGDRFSTITPDDHGGLIYIATFMAFTYSSVTFVTRCFIKWNIFGMDDWAMVVAQVREPKSLRGRVNPLMKFADIRRTSTNSHSSWSLVRAGEKLRHS